MFQSEKLRASRRVRSKCRVLATGLGFAWACAVCQAQTAGTNTVARPDLPVGTNSVAHPDLPVGTNTAILSPPADEQSRRRPLVVLKQSSIKGRVFFLTDSEDTERQDVIAAGISIRILTKSGGKRLHETKADGQGQFTLPNLDVGTYQMVVGRLYLELNVQEQTVFAGRMKLIPKTILIFMPQDLDD